MKNLKEYIGYISAIIMLCVWIVTIMWYGKKIDQNTDELHDIKILMQDQTEFNGKVKMYIELDSK